ncbi:hypothetical protein FQN60_009161, partial [Etheostoma spectabile]
MHRVDLSPFSVSPAAGLLARCVSRGVLSQVRTRFRYSSQETWLSVRETEEEEEASHGPAVPDAPGVVRSPAGRPEGPDRSETEADEAAGTHTPAGPSTP